MAAIPVDDFSPIYKGDTGTAFIVQFLHKYTAEPISLSNASVSIVMHEEDKEIIKTCTGVWTTDDAALGKGHFDFSATDVNADGNWKMYITITKSAKPVHADVKILEILPLPTP